MNLADDRRHFLLCFCKINGLTGTLKLQLQLFYGKKTNGGIVNPALLSRVADSLLSAFQRIQSIW